MVNRGGTMLDMAKSSKPSKKGPGRPAGRKPTTTIYARVEPSLGAALDAYLDSLRPRPTTTSVIVVAIEEYLKQQGFWPPPPAAP